MGFDLIWNSILHHCIQTTLALKPIVVKLWMKIWTHLLLVFEFMSPTWKNKVKVSFRVSYISVLLPCIFILLNPQDMTFKNFFNEWLIFWLVMITYFDLFTIIAAWVLDLSHLYVLLDKANTLHYITKQVYAVIVLKNWGRIG